MRAKTLTYALLGSMLLGTLAAAEENATTTAPAPAAKRHEPFLLRVEPDAQRILPGGEAGFAIHAKSRENVTLEIAVVRHSGDGYAYEVSPARLEVPAGGEAYAKLVVKARENASRGAVFQVVATDPATGEHKAAVAKVALAKPEPPAAREKPKPEPAARPNATRDVALAIEGFDEPGGLRLALRIGASGVLHIRVSPEALRAAHDMAQHGDAKTRADGRLWMRLQLADDGGLVADNG